MLSMALPATASPFTAGAKARRSEGGACCAQPAAAHGDAGALQALQEHVAQLMTQLEQQACPAVMNYIVTSHKHF